MATSNESGDGPPNKKPRYTDEGKMISTYEAPKSYEMSNTADKFQKGTPNYNIVRAFFGAF